MKIKSELHGDMKKLVEILTQEEILVTHLSVMPCHLNGDVHEWRNETVTVPN